MSKTSTDPRRHALNGATMGTRWSALLYRAEGFDPAPIRHALQIAVDEVDAQMSMWKPDSDLMRLNACPVGEWITVPERLMDVLRLSLDIGRTSGGAFDIGVGDAVNAWGFGPAAADQNLIREAFTAPRRPAHEVLELDTKGRRVRKRAPVVLDLNGIAKGYGVDRLAETLRSFGIVSGLVGIDGEIRALGLRPDGQPWTIAVEEPDRERRASHSILALQDAAVATSGDRRRRRHHPAGRSRPQGRGHRDRSRRRRTDGRRHRQQRLRRAGLWLRLSPLRLCPPVRCLRQLYRPCAHLRLLKSARADVRRDASSTPRRHQTRPDVPRAGRFLPAATLHADGRMACRMSLRPRQEADARRQPPSSPCHGLLAWIAARFSDTCQKCTCEAFASRIK